MGPSLFLRPNRSQIRNHNPKYETKGQHFRGKRDEPHWGSDEKHYEMECSWRRAVVGASAIEPLHFSDGAARLRKFIPPRKCFRKCVLYFPHLPHSSMAPVMDCCLT